MIPETVDTMKNPIKSIRLDFLRCFGKSGRLDIFAHELNFNHTNTQILLESARETFETLYANYSGMIKYMLAYIMLAIW